MARQLGLGFVLGEVDRVERRRPLGQALARPEPARQRLNRLPFQLPCSLDELAKPVRGHPLGGGIHGRQPLGADVGGGHTGGHLVGRDDEAVAPARVRPAVQHHSRAARQLVHHPRLVEPDGLHRAALVDDRRLNDRDSTAGAAPRYASDVRDHGRLLAGREGRDEPRLAAVLVTERQVLEQVPQGADPERLERGGGPPVADAQRLGQAGRARRAAGAGVELGGGERLRAREAKRSIGGGHDPAQL